MKSVTLAGASPRVLYVIWWEGVTENPLINHQVYDQLKWIRRLYPSCSVSLLSAGPFAKAAIRDRLISVPGLGRLIPNRAIRNRVSAGDIAKDLKSEEISFFTRDTVLAPASIYAGPLCLCLGPLLHLFYFRRLVRRLDAEIVHCRSYYATWVAYLARRLFGLSFRLVFDTRGLLPEEGVLTGAFGKNSVGYRAWKFVEKRLLDAADAVVNVSEPFTEYITSLTNNPMIRTIPASVDLAAWSAERGADGGGLSATINPQQRKVLLYIGSIGDGGWHSIENLARIFDAFRRAFGPSLLLVLTRNSHDRVRNALASRGIPDAEIQLVATRTAVETSAYARLAHYAVLPFKETDDPLELLIGKTMFATKTCEYLAAGLPILCHHQIGGVSRLIRECEVGCLFTPGRDDDFVRELRILEAQREPLRDRCLAAARRYDTRRNARLYGELYYELSGR